MTRKEEIKKASANYCEVCEPSLAKCGDYSFTKGAEWADNHPKCKWISVEDDLPCNHNEFITKDGITTMPVPTISYDGLLELHNMVKVMNSKVGDIWIWEEGISPQYWLNLPELI